MQQAQTSMQNPMAQAVPQSGGVIDPSIHPIIAKIIEALSGGAKAYGWTAMPPAERLERTQMEQQKAETMARLAQTGAYQQGELGYRRDMADVASQNAKTRQEEEQRKREQGETALTIKQQMADLATEKNEWQKELASGRLDAAKTRISNQAAQFEKTLGIRIKQVGIEQAKLELAQTGMGIKQGFLDLAGAALNQKGTAEGLQAIQAIQNLAFEHPIQSQLFGLEDVTKRVNESRGAGMPGVSPGGAPATGGPTAPLPSPPAPNKIDVKRNARKPAGSGVTHIFVPGQGIQPVQGSKP
jgi:hypothetical protein